MRQVWITKYGQPAVLQAREAMETIPRSGEVRVRVEAVGVTFADLMARLGYVPSAPSPPFVPGLEVAGVIDAVGAGVPDWREGDAVFALTRFGGYSESVCVPQHQVFKRLQWMSIHDAAALPVDYLLAYVVLIVMGSLRPGNKVLIHNAAGGVGLAALDICRIIGAETFGTASPEKHDFLRQRGIHHVIDYRNHDYERVINDLTGSKGVQLILDPLGGVNWPKNYRLLMPTGRLLHYGMSSAVVDERPSRIWYWRQLLMAPFYSPVKLMQANKSVAGVNILGLLDDTPAEVLQGWMKQIVAWYDEALFRPVLDHNFRFAQAAEAHTYLHERKNTGKVLLLP